MDAGSKAYDRLKHLHESGTIRLVEEPADLMYPAAMAVENGGRSICAVYGPPGRIEQLRQAGALTTRVGGQRGEHAKAYLHKKLSDTFLSAHPHAAVAPDDDTFLALAAAEYSDHRLGLCQHAAQGRAYLALGTTQASHTKADLERLAQPQDMFFMPQPSVPRGGHHLLPVSLPVAQAIARAHPDIIPIPAPEGLSSDTQEAMLQLAMHVRHIPSMQLPYPEKTATAEQEKPAKKQRREKELLEVHAPAHYIAQLRPYVKEIVRAERIGNQANIQLHIADTEEARALIAALNSAQHCSHPLNIQRDSTHKDQAVYAIRGRELAIFRKHINSEEVAQRDVYPSIDVAALSGARNVVHAEGTFVAAGHYATDKVRSEESLRGMVLLKAGPAKHPEYYLAAAGDSRGRCSMLAAELGASHSQWLTKETEFPAIVAFPVSETLAYRHLRGVEGIVDTVSNRHVSIKGMQDHLRTRFHVRNEAVRSTTVPASKPQRVGKKSISPREQAAAILFNGLRDGKILDLVLLTPPEDFAKRPVARLGIKLRGSNNKEKKMTYGELSADLYKSGFINAEHPLQPVEKEPWDKENSSFAVLELRSRDITAWRAQLEKLAAYEVPKNERGLALSLLRTHFSAPQPQSIAAEDAPWIKLAQYARAGRFKHIQLHYSAPALDGLRSELKRRCDEIDGLCRHRPEALDVLRRSELTPAHSYIADIDAAMQDTVKTIREHEHGFGPLSDRRKALHKALSHFDSWRATHAGDDGSITFDCLTSKEDESPMAAFDELAAIRNKKAALRLANPSVSKALEQGKKGWRMPEVLFPSDRFTVPQIVAGEEGSRGVEVVPVSAHLLKQLERYDGQLKRSQAPIAVDALAMSLRDIYRKPPEVNNVVSIDHSAMTRARRELMQDRFYACKPYMRYAELQENGMGRPVLLFTLKERSDWTQHVKPMLECMDRAKLLVHREDVAEGAVLPTYSALQQQAMGELEKINRRCAAIAALRETLESPEYTHHTGDMQKHFMREHLEALQESDLVITQSYREQLSRFMEGDAGKEDDLDAMRQQVLRRLRIEKDDLEEKAETLREEHHISRHDVAYEVSAQQRLAAHLLDAEGNPLEYKDIQSAVNRDFRAEDHAPLQFIAYLDLLPGGMQQQTTASDRDMALALYPKQVALGPFSAREAQPVQYPSREALFAQPTEQARRLRGV